MMSRPGRSRVVGLLTRLACGFNILALTFALGAVAYGAIAPSVPAPPSAEAERILERRVKAAFLFRFTEFITWPEAAFARPDSPFVIVVAGRDALADELRQITAGRSVGGHPVEVVRVSEPAIPVAHVVFVAEPEKLRLRDWIRAAPRHALVVTESEGALALGAVINFLLVEGRVRFEISLDAAERRGLRMSSRLLAVAHGVRTGTP